MGEYTLRHLVLSCAVAAVAGILAMPSALADYTWEYSEKGRCTFGADVRLRLTHFDRNVISPVWGNFGESGPALEYLRVRERIWGNFEFNENLCLNVRLVNRWHDFSSNIGDPNDRDAGTWQFPDEVVVDRFNLRISQFMDTDWTLTLGRQDFILGNGMVVLEGTPYDQGRTIYLDGITAACVKERDTVKLFGFYNDYLDKTVFINDRNRTLRRGDTWLGGVNWIHTFTPKVNTDLYYLFCEVDDDSENNAVRNHAADQNAQFSVFGGRVFGDLHEQVDYSGELAFQNGDLGDGTDMTGMMADLRLNLRSAPETAMSPEVQLQITHFSGDDDESADEFEGWHPVYAEYPIWREELLPILFNGNWTNLTQYRTALKLNLYDSERVGVRCSGAWALLIADEGGTPMNNPPQGGAGDNIGHLLSAFIDVALKDLNTSISLQASTFDPGDYWQEGRGAEWLRMQMVYTF